MAVADHFDTVQKIYIAFYQRPADPAGLYYWSQRIDSAGGDLSAVIDAFANSEEAVRLYFPEVDPLEFTLYDLIDADNIGDIIDSIYLALFDRLPDAAGKDFYVDGFIDGTFTAATIMLNVLNGAQNDDAVAVANKLEVSSLFTAALDPELDGIGPFQATYDADDEQAARDWLAAVTSNPTTRMTEDQVVEDIQTLIADEGDPILALNPGQTFTLTAGVDTVPGLIGSAGTTNTDGDDTFVGNAGTYNPGDNVDGGDGIDTFELDLVSSAVPYDVGSVTNVEHLFVNTTESAAEGAAAVTLLTSNFSGLETLTIEQSRADIDVQDLQNGTDVTIDDMRGDVNLNIDAQNALGDADEITVSIREFGDSAGGIAGDRDFADAAEGDTDGATGAADDANPAATAGDYGSYDSDLTIDAAIEIVNLVDNGTTGFESDLSIAGGFRQLNIDGGQAGVALTVHDVASSAFGEDGVTVDATGFSGDLAIDADAVDVLDTGAGDDTITTDMAYGGDIDAGNGDNLVIIGSAIGEDDANDDLLAGASVTTGSGEDTVRVDDDAAGSIATGADDDYVVIGASVGEDDWDGDLEETGSISTGAGADTVYVNGDANGAIDTGLADDTAADGDYVWIENDVGEDASITTGAGDDAVYVDEAMSGAITTGSENDHVSVGGDVDGAWDDLATITTEAGDDFVKVWGTLRDNGVIITGEGNDFVVIEGDVENAQDPFAPDPVDSDALVDLGADNDELVVESNLNGDVLAGTGDDDLLVVDGSIGNNPFTVAAIDGGEGADDLTLVDSDYDEGDTDITITDANADITGIETLNLIDDAASGEDDFDIDLDAFDGDLTNVNIAKYNAGNSETNLYNVAGETITISAEDNVTETDVTLNVTSADAALTVVLASDIDGDIVDGGYIDAMVAEGNTDFDVVLDDENESIDALNLVNNGTAINEFDDDKGRTVALDDDDFTGTLTITGDMANDREGYAESDVRLRNQQDGNLLAVTGIAAATIEAGTYAGDLNLTLAADQSYDITLGSGDDVVNMEGDDLDVGDVVDFGAGIDRLIVDETTQSTGDDSDEVFGDLAGLEELEVRGAGSDLDGVLEVSLDDDAFRSDLARVIVDETAVGGDANVLLDIGADFVDDDTDEGRDLRIDADNGVLEINNDSINNLDLYTDANGGGRDILISQNDGGVIDVSIGIDAGEDADIGAGATEGTLDDVGEDSFGYGNDGEVELDLANGTISTITLLDNGAGENGDINLVVAANWANSTLNIDASAITDDDIDNDTGGLTLDASAETDAVLTIDGTQNDDTITGGQQGDVINGNAGDDFIEGDVAAILGGADTIDGGEGNNDIYGMVGDDVITAGDGDNFVDGGDGNDTITLGNGANEAYGADGNDTIVAGGIFGLEGTLAIGGFGSDTITLGDGDNTVYGDEYGIGAEGGADTIVTGNGDDMIWGDFGGDLITANGGNDVFAYSLTTDSTGAGLGFDTINGFTVAADAFDLSWLADALGFTGVDFLGNFDNENIANSAIAATATTALEVIYVEYQAGDGEGYVYADTNASGDIDTSDLVIKIVGLDGALSTGNFTSLVS